MPQRIHLFGASGSGTTTLGRALAECLQAPHFDTDDFYWQPTDPPFREKRPPAERLRRIENATNDLPGWILSGSLCGWGDPLTPRFTCAVFLTLDPVERMSRLRRREQDRYGPRIRPGGDMHQASRDFMAWAQAYDTASTDMRSLATHEAWMQQLRCPIIRLESTVPTHTLACRVLEALNIE